MQFYSFQFGEFHLMFQGKPRYIVFCVISEVIYEQRERVFHRDIQTRENNGVE